MVCVCVAVYAMVLVIEVTEQLEKARSLLPPREPWDFLPVPPSAFTSRVLGLQVCHEALLGVKPGLCTHQSSTLATELHSQPPCVFLSQERNGPLNVMSIKLPKTNKHSLCLRIVHKKLLKERD